MCIRDSYITGPLRGYVSDEFSSWATSVHAMNSNVLLGLIVLHIVAVLAYLVLGKDDLISPMISGRKALEADRSYPLISNKPIVAGLIAVVSAAVAYAIFGR